MTQLRAPLDPSIYPPEPACGGDYRDKAVKHKLDYRGLESHCLTRWFSAHERGFLDALDALKRPLVCECGKIMRHGKEGWWRAEGVVTGKRSHPVNDSPISERRKRLSMDAERHMRRNIGRGKPMWRK